MSLRDAKAKPSPKLPGRVYTLLVTSLATLLIAIPLMRPSTDSWSVTAIVNHPKIQGPETATQIARQQLRSTAESSGILSSNPSKKQLAALRSNFATTTEPAGDGSFTTSIQFQHGDQKQARDIVSQVAYAIAEAAENDQAKVVSITAQPAGGIPRGKLLAALSCSLTVGFTTIFFPRRQSRPAESNADRLEQVTNATGLPVIGSVLSSPSKKKGKKTSNFPLRLTAFGAELVVVSTLLFALFAAASDSRVLSQMIDSPLNAYAQSVRTASAQFQSVLRR